MFFLSRFSAIVGIPNIVANRLVFHGTNVTVLQSIARHGLQPTAASRCEPFKKSLGRTLWGTKNLQIAHSWPQFLDLGMVLGQHPVHWFVNAVAVFDTDSPYLNDNTIVLQVRVPASYFIFTLRYGDECANSYMWPCPQAPLLQPDDLADEEMV